MPGCEDRHLGCTSTETMLIHPAQQKPDNDSLATGCMQVRWLLHHPLLLKDYMRHSTCWQDLHCVLSDRTVDSFNKRDGGPLSTDLKDACRMHQEGQNMATYATKCADGIHIDMGCDIPAKGHRVERLGGDLEAASAMQSLAKDQPSGTKHFRRISEGGTFGPGPFVLTILWKSAESGRMQKTKSCRSTCMHKSCMQLSKQLCDRLNICLTR